MRRPAMTKIRWMFAAIALTGAFTLAGCNGTQPNAADVTETSSVVREAAPAQTADAPVAEVRREVGTYSGLLPAADCEGIRTTLYVRADGTYTRISEYIGLDTFEEAGTWTTDSKGLTRMTPANAGDRTWLAEFADTHVHLLDGDGNRVQGPLAEHYVLKKN